MRKKIFAVLFVMTLWTSQAIAQPLAFLGEISPESQPQNYFYEEVPEIESYYEISNYRTYSVISTKKMRYDNALGFTPGACTYYVAQRRQDLFSGYGKNILQGNAYQRVGQAQQEGLEIGKEPKERAIAVFAPGRGAYSLGHVGYVEHVGDDGRIVISEMNYQNEFEITERIVPSDLAVAYIY